MNTYKTVVGGGVITNNVPLRANEIGNDFAPDLASIDNPKSNFLGIGKKSAKAKAKQSQRVLKREANKAKRVAKRAQGKGFFKGIIKTVKRFNPLSQMARAGTLGAFRLNLFGMATRQYPAFLSDAEITKRKFKKANAQRVKANWDKVADFWERKLGGKKKNLEQAIKSGYDKPIFRRKKKQFSGIDSPFSNTSDNDLFDMGNAGTMSVGARTDGSWEGMGWQYVDAIFEQIEGKDGKQCIDTANNNISRDEMILVSRAISSGEEKSGFAGVDDAVVLTAITTALPVIAQIIKMTGGDKNPYEAGTAEGDEYAEDLASATKDGEMTDPTVDQTALDKIVKEGEEDAKKGGEGDLDEIWGMPAMVVYVGGGILVTGILFLGLRTLMNRTK